jgi:adenylate cyclase
MGFNMDLLQETADEIDDREDGTWPLRRRQVIDWLVNNTRDERFIDNILVELCARLRAAGVPLVRATLHFRTSHPQWRGARLLWRTGLDEAEIDLFGHGVEMTQAFRTSPLKRVMEGEDEVRLDRATIDADDSPLMDDLRALGVTDYIVWPLDHTLGKRHITTFATDRPGGFADRQIGVLRDMLPALSLVTEIRVKNIMARTLLETYVGPHASNEILAGATTRGSGKTVKAAIMICDLRDFTSLSDMWPRDNVIELLNGYFDAMCMPIEKHGGEILKFMGDGLLAIFPLENPDACANLLASIREGQMAMVALNQSNALSGQPSLGYGVGVHVGDVMYGNIGSQKRLDFTVIGPAVNIASRLESLTKEVGRPVLLSEAFARIAGAEGGFDALGKFLLRGLGEPIDVFALNF